MRETLPRALSQLINFLEKLEKELGVKYYIVGGILVNIYTVFRATQDIDFVVDLQTNNISIDKYVSLLKKNNFFPLQDGEKAIVLANESKLIQYLDKKEIVKFDNYLIDKFDQSKYIKIGPIALKRRIRERLFNIECWVASKEDFIISKLVFGGWQDYSDALGCWMRFKERLDLPYMIKICNSLKIQKHFELLRSDIDDPDDFFKKINGF